ncbi:MAG TPA: DNA polymerase Y family protein [Candidatus Binatia bacterium]|nr:DNA polymerase Y family protein [Candidatus Binatia bacterium]
MRRIACLLVHRFAAAAIVRIEPALAGRPLVILGDTAPARLVIEATDEARAQGVRRGMTEGQLLAEPRAVVCRERSNDAEIAAHRALLEVALAHSPRVEGGGPGIGYLDVAGLSGLFGDERQIGARLSGAARELGLHARVGIAGSRAGARLAARGTSDLTVIPPGGEAMALAPAPLALLDLPPEIAARLARWGLRTLGDLAALPSPALFERMGEEGLALQRLARGEDPRPLHLHEPAAMIEEQHELDDPVDTLEPVWALLVALAARVCERLSRRQHAADRLEWICHLADGTEHAGQVVPAFPTADASAMGILLRGAVEARPPRAPVAAVLVRAWPIHIAPGQESFDGPLRPSPRRLAETMARLAALVGGDSLGAPEVLDTHRPDAIRLSPFTPLSAVAPRSRRRRVGRLAATAARDDSAFQLAGRELLPAEPEALTRRTASIPREDIEMTSTGEAREPDPTAAGALTLALRRFRPLRRAAVTLVGGRPVQVRAEGCMGRVVASAGPWRSSGEWWGESRWARDEWDIELQDGTICRIFTDGRTWSVEGIYD